MSLTYKTCGIMLKSMAMGEADRLLTILSPDKGLLKAVAPGARKPKSKLGGRTALFVVNDLMLIKGRSLDKLIQADVRFSYPGLSRDLAKLTTGQYWAELALFQGLSDQPQPELFKLVTVLFHQLEQADHEQVLSILVEGIYKLLVLAGIAPQLQQCCLSQTQIDGALAGTQAGLYFSYDDGGVVLGDKLQHLDQPSSPQSAEVKGRYAAGRKPRQLHQLVARLTAQDYWILQYLDRLKILADNHLDRHLESSLSVTVQDWLSVEKILRGYALHYFDRPIKSANLIESAFALPSPSHA